MTNEQLKEAIAIEAVRRWKERGVHFIETLANIAVELTQKGWTPPEPVDPDLLELETLWLKYADGKINSLSDTVLAGIKRGRALAAAEAKPGMVWVKHDGSAKSPVALGTLVAVKFVPGAKMPFKVGPAEYRDWQDITHYAIITPPEDK